MQIKTYSGRINDLPANGIFVFGSNTQGRHGRGAALEARKKWGAIYGQSTGIQGRSYAIVTKDLTAYTHPSITEELIKIQIKKLYRVASFDKEHDYYVVYSTEPNLNGYTPEDMARMFSSFPVPSNVVFNEEFAKLLTEGRFSDTISLALLAKHFIDSDYHSLTDHVTCKACKDQLDVTLALDLTTSIYLYTTTSTTHDYEYHVGEYTEKMYEYDKLQAKDSEDDLVIRVLSLTKIE